jgi:hypothetical protein
MGNKMFTNRNKICNKIIKSLAHYLEFNLNNVFFLLKSITLIKILYVKNFSILRKLFFSFFKVNYWTVSHLLLIIRVLKSDNGLQF